jgi:hypothetical protein
MAKLITTNKTIRPTSEKLSNSSSRDAVSLNSKRVRDDINRISTFINSLIIPSYKTLTSDLVFPYDALEWGISGETIVTWPENLGNHKVAHPIFWKSSSEIDLGRPCTIKESFDWVVDNFTTKIIQIEQAAPDLGIIEETLRCNLLKIEQLKKEVLTNNYTLRCAETVRDYEFTLSTHVYNILNQLTLGMDENFISPYNDSTPNYPNLEIPYSVIRDRIEYAYQLKDIDYGNGITQAGDGQFLIWRDAEADPDGDGGDGAWVPEHFVPTGVKKITDLDDVDDSARSEGRVLTWRGLHVDDTSGVAGAWVPEVPVSASSTEYITDLKDVDTTTQAPSENDILRWDSTHPDEDGNAGAWIPKSLELDGPIGQKLGSMFAPSTIEDIHGIESIIQQWRTDTGFQDLTSPGVTPSVIYDFFRRIGKRYRPGAMLQYDGTEKWHNALAGNISNLNAVTFIPELFEKGGTYFNSLSNIEKTAIIEGGIKPIPFVFINSFRLNFREISEPGFRSILYGFANVEDTAGLNSIYLSQDVIDLYNAYDSSSLRAVFNTNVDASSELLKGEITASDQKNPLGMTACSWMWDDGTDKHLEYRPNYLLGVSRSDLAYLPESLSVGEGLFLEDSSGNLTGAIDDAHIDAISLRVVSGIGSEVQHSGYSRIMVLGPYEIGENVYICPEPILRTADIYYPYGICISDSFLNKPMADLVDPGGILRASYPNIASYISNNSSFYNKSLFELVKGISAILTNFSAGSNIVGDYLTDSVYNKIVSNPVGFIVMDDSPRTSDYEEGGVLVNNICHNLLGESISFQHANLPMSDSALYTVITGFASGLKTALEAEGLSIFNHDPKSYRNIFEVDLLALPTIKIQLPSFKYEKEIHDINWVNYIPGLSGSGDLTFSNPAGTTLNLGDITGPEGPIGLTGEAGSSGSPGTIISNVVFYESIDGAKDLAIGDKDQFYPDRITVNHLLYPHLTGANYRISFNLRFATLTQKIALTLEDLNGNTIDISSDGSSFASSVLLDGGGNPSSITIISDSLNINDGHELQVFFEATEATSDFLGWGGVYSTRSSSYSINKF